MTTLEVFLWKYFGPAQYFLNDVDIVESCSDAGHIRLAFKDGSVLLMPPPAYDILDRAMARRIAQIQEVFDVQEEWFNPLRPRVAWSTKTYPLEKTSGDDERLRSRGHD